MKIRRTWVGTLESVLNLMISWTAQYFIFLMGAVVFVLWIRLPNKSKLDFSVHFAIAGLIAILESKGLAHYFYDTRPFVVLHRKPLFPHVPDNGFPSDHTTLTMMTALLWRKYSKPIGAAMMACSLMIGVARVASLVHSPVDIAGSILIASAAAGISAYFAPEIAARLGQIGKKSQRETA